MIDLRYGNCFDIMQDLIASNIKVEAVICDPPYQNTTGYTTGDFSHEEFWEYMRELSKRCTVFISEQIAPDDFECVWQKELTRTLDYNKNNQPKKVEKLFVWRG